MLQTKYKANDVISLKLVTGEEVIGYYVRTTGDGEIIMRKPTTIVPTDTGLAFAPFMMTSDYLKDNTEMPFNVRNIIINTPSSKSFADAYMQQFSGLDMTTESKPKLII